MQSETVLITGAAGYIGSTLCPYLAYNGYKVIAVDNMRYNQWELVKWVFDGVENIEFHNLDACNMTGDFLNLLDKSLYVIPLAALVGMPICNKYHQEAWEVNEQAIKYLMDNIKINSGKKIIFPNSNSAYGKSDVKCTEESPFLPLSHYARTKCNAEKYVLGYANSVVFRLATVYGVSPRMRWDLMVNDFVWKAVKDKELKIFEGKYKRNFVHIMDVCRGFRFAMAYPGVKGVYNLGNPHDDLTKLQLANKIAEQVWLETGDDIDVQEESGTDSDQRDYSISNDKIISKGFQFLHTIDSAIPSLVRLVERSDIKVGNV